MKKLQERLKAFFSRPDWILSKEFFFALLSLPVAFIAGLSIYMVYVQNRVESLSEEVKYVERLVQSVKKERAHNLQTINEDYVVNVLGSLRFLAEDRKRLSLICTETKDSNLFPKLKERLAFLQSGENSLVFESEERGEQTLWSLTKPVEMNCADIKRLITLVEGQSLGEFSPHASRPNIYFRRLNINRANKGPVNVFNVDLEILQKR